MFIYIAIDMDIHVFINANTYYTNIHTIISKALWVLPGAQC